MICRFCEVYGKSRGVCVSCRGWLKGTQIMPVQCCRCHDIYEIKDSRGAEGGVSRGFCPECLVAELKKIDEHSARPDTWPEYVLTII